MNKLNVIIAVIAAVISISITSCNSVPSVNLNKGIDSASYAIGLLNGASLRAFPGEAPVNTGALIAGLLHAYKNDSSAMKMTVEESQTFIQAFIYRAQEEAAAVTKAEGEKFLAENKTKPGVITTQSGLQYLVEKEGDGERPTADSQVKVHYTGTLLDGTKFDSSYDHGEPAVFNVRQVISGWSEGLQIMPVGSKYIFWVPSGLAYGAQGAGQDIKPNSTLKFEVELLEIVAATE